MEELTVDVDTLEKERLSSLLVKCVAGFFVGVYDVSDTVGFGPHLRLREDLWLDHLGLEELSVFLTEKLSFTVPFSLVDQCFTVSDLLAALQTFVTATQSPYSLFPSSWAVMPTIWAQEARGKLGTGEPWSPGVGYSKDDKLFARLRRSYRELKRPFEIYWNKLTPGEQRSALFAAAMLPLGPSLDAERFPASLRLLPKVHVQAMQGHGLLSLLEQRAVGDFRDISRGDMEYVRSVAESFSCPSAWDNQIMILEGRRQVTIKSHKDEARLRDLLTTGQAVPGKLWAIYSALTGSIHALLNGLLDDFRKKQVTDAKLRPHLDKHSCCDVCGVFAEKLKVCGRCRKRWFCSKKCQADDWPTHKKTSCETSSTLSLKFE